MANANSNSATGPSSVDHLEGLERLAAHIPNAIRDRNAEQALRRAGEAAKAAESNIALLEQLAGFSALVREDIGVTERSQIERDLRDFARSGGVIAAAATAETLEDAIEELRRLSGRVPLVERPIVQAWQRRVEATFDTGGNLGNVLQMIPETRAIGEEFNNLHRGATTLKLRRGEAGALAANFEELEGRLEALRANLSRVGVGKEVIEFLVAVSEQRATLALLTLEVRDWLTDRDALELFHVTL